MVDSDEVARGMPAPDDVEPAGVAACSKERCEDVVDCWAARSRTFSFFLDLRLRSRCCSFHVKTEQRIVAASVVEVA